MRQYFYLTTCLVVYILSVSSANAVTFEKCFGGTGDDRGFSVTQTSDLNYIIVGATNSYGAGGCDVYLIKTDSLGDTLWTKTYGGIGIDDGRFVVQTIDSGYIITGYTDSYGAGENDVWLIKTDSLGDTLWTKTYGGNEFDFGESVQQTIDSGYIIVGTTESYGAGWDDVYLIKTNSLGDTLWTKIYGGIDFDFAEFVQQTADSGYIITGSTYSYGAGAMDIYLIKTDSLGDTLWTKTYGSVRYELGKSVAQTIDFGYIITGYRESNGAGNYDVYLIKTNSLGDTLWTKTYGGDSIDYGYSVAQTHDSGYIIAGSTDSYGADLSDVYLIKTDSLGDTLWTKTYGGDSIDYGYSVAQTVDLGYIIAGYTNSYGAGNYDVYLIKTDSLGNVGVTEDKKAGNMQSRLFTAYPNPFRNVTTFRIAHAIKGGIDYSDKQQDYGDKRKTTLDIYDVSGRLVKSFVVPGSEFLVPTSITWSGTDQSGRLLPSGVYFIKLTVGDNSEIKKALLIR